MKFFKLEPHGYRYDSCMRQINDEDNEYVDHVYMSKAEYYFLLNKAEINNSIINKFQKIMKDRSNSDRGIKPKKAHTGYIYIYTAKEKYKYKHESKFYTIDLFKSSFQTPYTIDYSYTEVMTMVLNDFGVEYDDCYASAIGIDGIKIFEKYEDIFDAAEKEAFSKDKRVDEDEEDFSIILNKSPKTIRDKVLNEYLKTNFIIEPTLRANGLTSYYELIFKHRYEIHVPENMMKKRKKKKQNEEEKNEQ